MLLGVELDAPLVAAHFGLVRRARHLRDGDVGRRRARPSPTTSSRSRARRCASSSQSVVGITQDTQQAVARGPGFALVILALVSLVLAVVNLFPFLPLDGGHVLWSVVEKVRGRRVSLDAMWRFSSVGIVLLAFLVLNGVGNDISRLSG